MIINKYIDNYFLILFSLIPLSILIGSSASLINIILIDLSFLILIIYYRNFDFLKDKSILYLLHNESKEFDTPGNLFRATSRESITLLKFIKEVIINGL